jgi:thiamine-phosphate pyrophosphorylase
VPEPRPLRVMLVTDRRATQGGLADLARTAAHAGLDDLQVREKDLPARPLLALVREILAAVRGTPVRVFVNGHPDVAFAAGAHGVQLPEEGLPVGAVKRAFPTLRVGASRHSIEGVRQAESDGADFVLFGPIFETPGKEARALGAEALADAAQAAAIPVYAIGGVDAGNVRLVAESGAAGVALLRPFTAGSPAATLASLRGALA